MRRLRRQTSSGRYLPEIEGLRFLAIAAVFALHLMTDLTSRLNEGTAASSLLEPITKRGAFGVELFFVLSGFIIALPFVSHRLSGGPRVRLKDYFLRRLTRLEPPYLASILVAATVLVLTTAVAFQEIIVPALVGSTYLYGPIFRERNPVNGVFWSLEIEVQFYVVAPLLMLLFLVRSSKIRRLILLVAIAGLALQPWSPLPHRGDPLIRFTLIPYLSFFLVGLFLADVFVTDWRGSPRRTYAADLLFVAAAVGIVLVPFDRAGLYLPFLLFALVWAGFRGALIHRALSLRGITLIGGMCYSIYLLHYLVLSPVLRRTLHLTDGLPTDVQFLVQFFLVGIPVLIVTGSFYLLVERPCMERSWPRTLRDRSRALWTRFWGRNSSVDA